MLSLAGAGPQIPKVKSRKTYSDLRVMNLGKDILI